VYVSADVVRGRRNKRGQNRRYRTSLRNRGGRSASQGRAVRPCRRQPRRGDLDGCEADAMMQTSPVAQLLSRFGVIAYEPTRCKCPAIPTAAARQLSGTAGVGRAFRRHSDHTGRGRAADHIRGEALAGRRRRAPWLSPSRLPPLVGGATALEECDRAGRRATGRRSAAAASF
jgi:hypothetical protein